MVNLRLLGPSALALACLLTPRLPALVINEIMYHPREEIAPGVEDKGFEWIELYNEHADPLDLSGYFFSKGIDFTFPQGTFLLGRGYVVVCGNVDAVKAKYDLEDSILFEWNVSTALDDAGEAVALANPSGLVETEVSYNDRGRWPAGADGTGHSLALLSPYREVDDPDSWALSPILEGSPGGPNFTGQVAYRDETIVDNDEVWMFFKGTQAPPQDWNQRGFDDSEWLSGQTGIGYGDGDDRTVLSDMKDSYLTIFCRKKFRVDPSKVKDLVIGITYDDGFYAYLNGSLVTYRNVTSPAWNIGAKQAGEPIREEIDITGYKGLLDPASDNVLAFQVHNANLGSTDLSFIPRLISREIIVGSEAPTAPVVLNEGFLRTAGERWIELYNVSGSPVDLSGFHITDDRLNLTKATLPPGTTIPERGRLAFTDQELGLNFSLASPAPRLKVFVALVNPQGTRVVDAYSFKPAIDEKSEARIPDGGKEMAPAAVSTRGEENAVALVGGRDIVINEIMYHPLSENPADEYIELYNRGPDAVDLAGFQIEKAVEFLFPEVVIVPGGYVVIARDPDRIAEVYDLPREMVLGPWYRLKLDSDGDPLYEPASLNDAGERIVLLDPYGNVADSVRYSEGGEWSSWADGGGSSLELIDPFQDNDTPQSWDASIDSDKSVPQEFSYIGRHPGGDATEPSSELHFLLLSRGIAVVDNISVWKGSTQYVPNGTFDIDGSGWTMEGTHVNSGQTTDPSLAIEGEGSLKVISTGSGDNKANRIETDLTARLEAYNTTTKPEYVVGFTARWIVGSRTLMTRGYNHGLARVHYLDVPERLGTPGGQNSVTARQIREVGEADLGPVIDKVAWTPVVPEGGEPVVVTARIRDSDGIRQGTAKVWYALNSPTASWTAVDMTGPDLEDRFSATILGKSLNTRVLFTIAAEDDGPLHLSGRYPLDHVRRTHPPILDPANPGPGDLRYGIYRHDTRFPSTLYPSYRFVMHQANSEYLWNRPVLANDLAQGTFIFGAEKAYSQVGIRWSGSPFLRGRGWGNSYRVRFPGDDLLNDRFKRVDLENHGTDGRERLSHYLLRYSNAPGIKVPYTLQWYVRWQVNGDIGTVYEHVPRPDNDFLDFWFPDDDAGDFFKVDDRFEFRDGGGFAYQDARLSFPPYQNLSYPTLDPESAYESWKENYRWYFNMEAKENRDDWTNLIQFSQLLGPPDSSQPSASYDRLIPSYADIEEMLRVWAVRMNTDDWDSWGASRGKNCYLYRRESDGLWVLIAWDMELTYANVNSFPLAAAPSLPIPVNSLFPEVYRMLNRPYIKRRFYGILKEMVDRQFDSAFLEPWLKLLYDNGTIYPEDAQPVEFIEERAKKIRDWISQAVYPQQRLVVTTNGGNPYSVPGPMVDISGNAPAEVYWISVTRNDVLLDPQPQIVFSTTDMKGWKAVGIPLLGGVNRIGFHGFKSDTDFSPESEVDFDYLDVTISAPPTLAGLEPAAGGLGDTILLTGANFRTGLQVLFGSREASASFDEAADPSHITALVPGGLDAGIVQVKVKNPDARQSNAMDFEVRASFIRGDANVDGKVDLSDVLKVLFFIYEGVEPKCREALDADREGVIGITDAIRLLDYLFLDGLPLPAPFPGNGTGPAALGCDRGL